MEEKAVRLARPDEAHLLSELAFAAKAHWGYTREFLESARAELTLTAAQLASRRAHVLEQAGQVLGFFTVAGDPPRGELADLFVSPRAMRRGIGTALLQAAQEVAARAGFRELDIHADPNAERFYLDRGAIRVGEVPSGSIPGRRLPLLRLSL